MRIFSVIGMVVLSACGADTVSPGAQNFNDFESWGSGIEGFSAAPTNPTDTGNTSSGNTLYDGDYTGTYTLSVSSGGNTCTFSSVTLFVNITNGSMASVFEQPASSSCTFNGSTSTYSAKMLFDGVVGADTAIAGMFYEDTGFIFEGNWSGYISDFGGGSAQLAGTFNQQVSSINPGGLITVSGSFSVSK